MTLERIHPRPLTYLSRELQGLVRGRLWLQVIIGMMLGLLAGFLLGPSVGLVSPQAASIVANWLAFPGRLFLALVQMIVIPLVFASIIRGLAASESVEQLKKLGSWVAIYFVFTTTCAIVIGLVVATTVEPGRYIDSNLVQSALGSVHTLPAANTAPGMPALSDMPQKLLGILPTNPLATMVQAEMLGIVIFAVIVGVALVMMVPEQAKPLLDLLGSLQQVCMTIVRWAMWLAPYAVFGLMAQLTAKIGIEALLGMAVYVLSVIFGLLLLFCLHLVIVVTLARRGPLAYIKSVREVLLLAFSTSSSAAVMPLTLRTAEEKLRVRPSVGQFIIPIGATINMDGTALYQGMAAVFLAQVFGVDIGIAGMLLIVVTAVGASIGTPATPGVGIVILSMLLATINVPAAGIALILGVDRLLDMCRTAINVNGDLVAAAVMNRWIGGPKSFQAEMEEERDREFVRGKSGTDSLVGPPPAA